MKAGEIVEGTDSFVNWVLAGVATLLGAAATAIASLWKVNESRNSVEIAELKSQLQECEGKHQSAQEQILALSVQVAELRGKLNLMSNTCENGKSS